MSRLTLAYLTTVLAIGLHATAGPVRAQSELNGAWELVGASGRNADGDWKWDNVQPSLFIFYDGHCSIMYVAGNESRPLMADTATRSSITNEEMRSIFMPFIANSGTYEVSGSSITTKPLVALWPNFMERGSATYDYRVENDTLVLSAEGDGWSWAFKLRRRD